MELDPLVTAYLKGHPAAAAGSLGQVDAAALAAFLAAAPAATAAGVMTYFMPAVAADALARMEAPVAAEILQRLPNETAVPVLRLIPAERRPALYRTMPRASALRLRLQLRYPEALVGSLADPDAITLVPEQRVADALQLMRGGTRQVSPQIYVVDGERRLVGYVDLTSLIGSRERTPVSRILKPPPLTLNARAPLHTAEELDAWLEFESLPVVDRRGAFQGVLRRDAISREGRSLLAGVSADREFGRTRTALAEIFWLAVGALLAPREGSPAINRKDE